MNRTLNGYSNWKLMGMGFFRMKTLMVLGLEQRFSSLGNNLLVWSFWLAVRRTIWRCCCGMASGTCAFCSVTAWWWPKASNRPATANQIYVHCAEEATQFLSYLQELPNTFFSPSFPLQSKILWCWKCDLKAVYTILGIWKNLLLYIS